MTCYACPFAFTAESEQAQNYGCLPTLYEAMELQRSGINWCCHEDETKPCAGQVVFCHEENIPYDKNATLANYTKWYQTGEPK